MKRERERPQKRKGMKTINEKKRRVESHGILSVKCWL
jgi:hypothetical protein